MVTSIGYALHMCHFSNGNRISYLIVSDTTDKGKDTVYTFVRYLVGEVISNSAASTSNSLVPEIVFFTDGPSSEFKNRYIIKTLNLLAMDYGTPFEWQYFATSHGKGVVDGRASQVQDGLWWVVGKMRPWFNTCSKCTWFCHPSKHAIAQDKCYFNHTARDWSDNNGVKAMGPSRSVSRDKRYAQGCCHPWWNCWLTEGEADAALQVKY